MLQVHYITFIGTCQYFFSNFFKKFFKVIQVSVNVCGICSGADFDHQSCPRNSSSFAVHLWTAKEKAPRLLWSTTPIADLFGTLVRSGFPLSLGQLYCNMGLTFCQHFFLIFWRKIFASNCPRLRRIGHDWFFLWFRLLKLGNLTKFENGIIFVCKTVLMRTVINGPHDRPAWPPAPKRK